MFEPIFHYLGRLVGISGHERAELVHLEQASSRYCRYADTVAVDSKFGRVHLYTILVPAQQQILHEGKPMPLCLFIHGLGGASTQFETIMGYFSAFSNVMAIDLPGHGYSLPAGLETQYSFEALSEYITKIVRQKLDALNLSSVVLIGHSMGAILALCAACQLGSQCDALILITPPTEPPRWKLTKFILSWIPLPLLELMLNLWRSYDQRGGLQSRSVRRFISPASSANSQVLAAQLRVNQLVRSKPWLQIARGYEPPTDELCQRVPCPALIITANDDTVTPPQQGRLLAAWLRRYGKDIELEQVSHAGHAVIFERPEVVAALITGFVTAHTDNRFELVWQPQAASAPDADKWSLKNEEKWRLISNVGKPVRPAMLRGMKTLQQEDAEHSPERLEALYPDLVAIIDISWAQPPYDPSSFQRIKYFKYPTVSKIPPSKEEVQGFNQLVDKISRNPNQSIAVHCHYGFNRTGFFICSYLVEVNQISVECAIKQFADSRPQGIRHQHFIDELRRRYGPDLTISDSSPSAGQQEDRAIV